MDLDKINDAAPKIDKAFDSYWNLFKKHWWKLIIVGVIYFFYWAFTTDFEEEPAEVTKTEEIADDDYVVIKKSFTIDKEGYRKGDTIYIDYYSDGYVEKYYTDGESYYE